MAWIFSIGNYEMELGSIWGPLCVVF